MGFDGVVRQCGAWAADEFKPDGACVPTSTRNATKILGGLLSIYVLSDDARFLGAAKRLGDGARYRRMEHPQQDRPTRTSST